MMFSLRAKALSVGLLFLNLAGAVPVDKRADNLTPVVTSDFPDPVILQENGTWYAFASQSAFDNKEIKVQVATSPDYRTWTIQSGFDALGSLSSWVNANNPAVWAPSVSQRQDGKYIMYFSATTTTAGDTDRFHCFGTAVSDTIQGPYDSNSDDPFACPTNQGGAIDASGFIDSDGTNYVVYKIDANAIGHGGNCNNGVEPILSTPIMIQQVQADGTTKIGDPQQILTNDAADGPLVEAPYMIKSGDTYILFFSSNCYTGVLYDVSYATATSPLGPFTKSTTPLFVTGTQGLIGPGGASVASDGKSIAFHGYASEEAVGNVRSMYVTTISFDGGTVVPQ